MPGKFDFAKWVFVISAIIFLITAIFIIRINNEYRQGQDEYTAIEQYIRPVAIPGGERQRDKASEGKFPEEKSWSNAVQREEPPSIRKTGFDINWTELKGINEQLVGWILTCEGDISYPIVQGDDNSYYLNHTFSKQVNGAGCVFMRNECNEDYTSFQTILYGHNMKNGAMFQPLLRYQERDYWEQNPFIEIYTEDELMVYKIFSAYMGLPEEVLIDTDIIEKDKKLSLIEAIKNKSIYKTDIAPDTDDSILVLITCDNSGKRRFVVNAVRYETD